MDRLLVQVGEIPDPPVAPVEHNLLLDREIPAGEIHLLLPLRGDGEPRRDEVPLPLFELGDHPVPGGSDDIELHAEVLAEALGQVVLESGGLIAIEEVAVGVVPGDHGEGSPFPDGLEGGPPALAVAGGESEAGRRQAKEGDQENGSGDGRHTAALSALSLW